MARAGTSVTAVPTGNGLFALFVIGTDGGTGSGIYTSTGSPTTSWTNWPRVGSVVVNASTPRVTVIPDSFGKFTLFYVGTDRQINPVTGNADTGWTFWPAAAPGEARSDTPVTALLTADGHFALFVIGTNSHVYANIGAPQSGWFGWAEVPGVLAGAGTSVTAVRVGGTYYLFVPDDVNGEVRDTSGHY